MFRSQNFQTCVCNSFDVELFFAAPSMLPGISNEGLFARHWLLQKSHVPVTLIGFGDKLFIQYGTASLALLHTCGRASEFFGGFPPDSRSSALHQSNRS